MSTATRQIAIPKTLRSTPRWILWKSKDEQKRPYHPSGRLASVADPATWTTYENATKAAGRFDGLGFVFAEEDDIVGVDLDECRDPSTGQLEAWASTIVDDLASYAEASPSGTGVKVFCRGDWPGGTLKTPTVEMYKSNRFFTVTGEHLEETPLRLTDCSDQLGDLYAQRKSNVTAGETPPSTGLSDEVVMILAGRGQAGDRFRRLMSGDPCGLPSDSEVDIACCGRLAFYCGNDPEQIERIYSTSAPARREKWRREDYVERTIQAAIALQRSFFEPRGIPEVYDVDEKFQSSGPAVALCGQVLKGLLSTDSTTAVTFALARKLKTLGRDTNPEQYQEEIQMVCDATGRNFDVLFTQFCETWGEVRFAEGENEVDEVLAEADWTPYPAFFTPNYQRTASFGYWMSRRHSDREFFFPRKRLCEVLDVDSTTIGLWIKRMIRDGLIECVSADWKYTGSEKKAKVYRWIGPALEEIE